MKIFADTIVLSIDKIRKDSCIEITDTSCLTTDLLIDKAIVYPAMINSHDHLVGNWYPPAISEKKYVNSHLWVEDMKGHDTYKDRNKFWINDGTFVFSTKKSQTLCNLGVYKNIFGGSTVVQDHAPNQDDSYYNSFPIKVLKEYRQCHSLPMGNWWGGKTAEEELELSRGKVPFIVHLGEGTDDITGSEFGDLISRDLLKENTILIHGVALKDNDIDVISKNGATVCWCPKSNENLLGAHMNIESCLKHGARVVIGTDSTLSGSINLFKELQFIKSTFPNIAPQEVFKMVTSNAAEALKLPNSYGTLEHSQGEMLILDSINEDPFENLMQADSINVKLLLHHNKPIFGDAEFLNSFAVNSSEYTLFDIDGRAKFVIGKPQDLVAYVNTFMDYTKTFPYIPIK
ncbi:MAG: hypothetical protein B6226_02985 [Candidatus Cloacimonetes bacterium 4572_65]|nr:MAG: hypothetical protein B6226_02985 [Candidatus Cloacimonetes bacterium 4572_65]